MKAQLRLQIPRSPIALATFHLPCLPCVCRVKASSEFSLEFQRPMLPAEGSVVGWDPKLISDRFAAGAGGEYSHFCHGRVTLKEIEVGLFDIVKLDLFDNIEGWRPILIDGLPSPLPMVGAPGQSPELDALVGASQLSRKQQRILEKVSALNQSKTS